MFSFETVIIKNKKSLKLYSILDLRSLDSTKEYCTQRTLLLENVGAYSTLNVHAPFQYFFIFYMNLNQF